MGNPNSCWHPETTNFDGVEYNGTLSKTVQGFNCINWKEAASKTCQNFKCDSNNFCRKFPDDKEHWCNVAKVDDYNGWGRCDVPQCESSAAGGSVLLGDMTTASATVDMATTTTTISKTTTTSSTTSTTTTTSSTTTTTTTSTTTITTTTPTTAINKVECLGIKNLICREKFNLRDNTTGDCQDRCINNKACGSYYIAHGKNNHCTLCKRNSQTRQRGKSRSADNPYSTYYEERCFKPVDTAASDYISDYRLDEQN